MRELVLLIGLPGAGKSTFYRERLAESHVLMSKDLIPRSADKPKRQRMMIETALAEGRSVVVDNVHASAAEREEAIAVGRAFSARVISYWFQESVAACRERNAGREGAARVPLVAIYTAAKRFMPLTREEGIDQVLSVQLTPEGFKVDPLE